MSEAEVFATIGTIVVVVFIAGMFAGALIVARRLNQMRAAAELLLDTVRADGDEPLGWPCSCDPEDPDDQRWGCPRCRLSRAGLVPPCPSGPPRRDEGIPF